jgi:hypothetical protein
MIEARIKYIFNSSKILAIRTTNLFLFAQLIELYIGFFSVIDELSFNSNKLTRSILILESNKSSSLIE